MKYNLRHILIFPILFSSLVSGCASPQVNYKDDALKRIADRNWDSAYGLIEVALGSDDSKTRLWGYDLIVANPELKLAATRSFSPEAVEKAFSINDPITANDIESYRLELYSKYASDAEIERASNTISKAFNTSNIPRLALQAARRATGSGLIVTDVIFQQLTSGDQASLKLLYPSMQVIPQQALGKIVSFQVINRSTAGSSSGSQLGSALGQAAYIDRSIPSRNYSAVSQIGAGLVGAIIGSSLNKSPEQRFLINYGVELMDGAVKGVTSASPDGIAAPVGQCVFVSDVKEAPTYLCSDTLVGFINRAGKQRVDGSGVKQSGLETGIKCKVSSVATLTLSPEDCRRLNGEATATEQPQ